MVGLLIWILFGALVGWLTSIMMNTDAQQGPLTNILLGIAGALVGGFIMRFLGYDGVSGFNLYSVLVAILGSVILVVLYKAVKA